MGRPIKIRWPSALPIVDQIVAQVELKILAGEVVAGEQLPSVRALARRIGTRPATVHAAYRRLEAHGNVVLRRGAGAFVLRGDRALTAAPATVEDALAMAARLALGGARADAELPRVVAAWFGGAPLAGILAVDPAIETAEVMAAELAAWSAVPIRARSLAEVEAEPALARDHLTVALPFHGHRIERVAPRPLVVTVCLGTGASAGFVERIPAGATLLVVAHSPRALPYARALVESLRGDEIVLCGCLASAPDQWRRVAAVADRVMADAVAWPAVARHRRDAHRFSILDPDAARAVGGSFARAPARGAAAAR